MVYVYATLTINKERDSEKGRGTEEDTECGYMLTNTLLSNIISRVKYTNEWMDC